MNIGILKKIGFSDKQASIYLALLRLGPSSVRELAEKTDLNRGVVYDALKWLQEKSLVDFYEKEAKQNFVAEDPSKLKDLLMQQEADLKETETALETIVPELKSLYDSGGERPVARYYDKSELNFILEDVLASCEAAGETVYRIYSTAGVREYLYDNFPTFSDARIAKGIYVKAIAIGEGGELRGLDERKWLRQNVETPTYIIMYPGKTAYISLDAKKEPVGVVVENEGVHATQKIIFDALWASL